MELWLYLALSLGINILLFIPAFIFKTDKLTDLSYAATFAIIAIVATNESIESQILTIAVCLWALRLGGFLFIRVGHMGKDKRFDGVRNHFFKFLQFWIMQAVVVWIVLLPVLLSAKYYLHVDYNFIIGLVLWAIGLVTESVADWQKFQFKKKHTGFIKSGLWKFSRHPNYFGEILCWVGLYIAVFGQFLQVDKLYALASPLIIILLLLYGTGIPTVEKAAEKKYGVQYKEYQKKTSVLVPWMVKK